MLGLLRLEYLGYFVSKDGLKTDPPKFKVILECLHPTNVGEFKYFLGISNYYSKPMPYFAKIVASL